ncbi:MAG: YraN family protein [Bacteroidota bacterium]
MGKHNTIGKLGEEMAVKYLKTRGYSILCRNYRYRKAEIDIIARKNEILSVVEVKTRSGEFLEDVSDTINSKKIKLLMMATDHFVNEEELDVEVRFDIIAIRELQGSYKLEHIQNAFYHF